MGYHVTILRTKGKRTVPISMEEVLALPAVFPQWKYDADQEGLVSLDEREDAPALWFSDGELWTSNPSDETLTAMIAIADHLGARVRGDEMETYRTATESYLHPDDVDAKAESDAETRALLRRTRMKTLILNAAIFGFFVLLALLLKWLGFLE